MPNADVQLEHIATEQTRQSRASWLLSLRSKRLVVLTVLAGTALTLFGLLAFWQITQVFSLIDEQRRYQTVGNDMLRISAQIDVLLRKNNTVAIAAIHALDADRSADISGIRQQQALNRQELEAALTELDRVLMASGNPRYVLFQQQIQALVEETMAGREQMVRDFQVAPDLAKYVQVRDGLQAKRTNITDSMLQLRYLVEPGLDASQRLIDQQLSRALLVSCVTLAISGVLIFMLGWMLVSYVYKRDQAEQLARDQAVRLGTIMNNVPDGIVVLDRSGSIESWNAGAERMFGYRAAEIIHRNISVLMPEPGAGSAGRLAPGDLLPNRLREFTARRQDGSEFPADLHISEMALGDKRMFTCVIRDITERRAVEQMKSEFISTVSHELRTPLTAIAGSLTLLVAGAAGALPDKAQRLIGMAEKNCQRLGRLINDILDLEKAEAGHLKLRLAPVGLLPLLRHSLELTHSYAARFEIALVLKSGVAEVSVRGDEARLLQIMSNLLSNAIKHSPARSRVLVEVTLNSGFVRVTVHDAGPGIAEEFKAKVFQRFAQADNSDARRQAGTGLGLAITKQLVEQHGGRIGFDTGQSKVGGSGASFWFELPLAPPTAGADYDEVVDKARTEI